VAWFRCFIHGDHFPGQRLGVVGRVGFYVTRFVEAVDEAAAASAALHGVHADPTLAPPPGYPPTGRERVCVEEIVQVPAESVPATKPGHAWYLMDGAAVEPATSADGGGAYANGSPTGIADVGRVHPYTRVD
jgi:hypothetical protein